MRIVDALTNFINTTHTITDVDTFYTESSERFMIRQDPSIAVETRYFDGSRTGSFAYSIYAKSMNAQTAVARLFEVENLLDIPEGFDLEIGIQGIKNEIVQSSHFVTKTDKDEKIYTSSFMLDYYMEG